MTRATKLAWKFLVGTPDAPRSNWDDSPWEMLPSGRSKWRRVAPPKKLCHGLNACHLASQAFDYVPGTVLALVEYRGNTIEEISKLTATEMRILKAWEWTAEYSSAYSVWCVKRAKKWDSSWSPRGVAISRVKRLKKAEWAALAALRAMEAREVAWAARAARGAEYRAQHNWIVEHVCGER